MPANAAPFDDIAKEDFFEPGLAPVHGPKSYDLTIVYFMDYQCPACRKHTPDVTRALKEERGIRVIYRDTPIFGPRSEAAARVAIASQFQGKHEAMHQALMRSPMPLDEQALKAAAKKAGVDWARLQRDLEKRGGEIDRQISRNMELSRATGIAGTPAFIVGDYLANGVLDYEGMKGTIADARKSTRSNPSAPPEPEADAPADAESEEPVSADLESASPASGDSSTETEEPAVQFAPVAGAPQPGEAVDDEASGQRTSGSYWRWAAAALAVSALVALALRRRRVGRAASPPPA